MQQQSPSNSTYSCNSNYASSVANSEYATEFPQYPPLNILVPLSYSFIVDLCLHRYCVGHVHKHLPGPLRKMIQAYVCEALTDETIRTAVGLWCTVSGDEGNRRLTQMRYGDIAYWDVHKVTVMSRLFHGFATFNDNIELWDVSNVKDMSSMFFNATSFNQLINNWNVSNVKNMHGMFCNAVDFNQPLDTWDVSNVTYMANMFQYATLFNQPLPHWNIHPAMTMDYMFYGATSFNQAFSTQLL